MRIYDASYFETQRSLRLAYALSGFRREILTYHAPPPPTPPTRNSRKSIGKSTAPSCDDRYLGTLSNVYRESRKKCHCRIPHWCPFPYQNGGKSSSRSDTLSPARIHRALRDSRTLLLLGSALRDSCTPILLGVPFDRFGSIQSSSA